MANFAKAMHASLAKFNNTNFTSLGGMPANFGQSSCPCAYQRMKRSQAVNIFF
jgi:hypothetical protein